MKKVLTLLLLIGLSFQPLSCFAQSPSSTPPPQNPVSTSDDDEVVRISTNLIQLDVTVTDKEGNRVPDLKPEDFEILENNDTKKISNFSYISLGTRSPTAPSAAPNKLAPPVPAARIRPENVRRTIALVVDDLLLSWESMAYVRAALKKFVDDQLQPGDLVAIIRSSGGIGALQQFTTDKRQLTLAIERLQWFPLGRSRVGAFSPAVGAVGALGRNDAATGDPTSDENEFREQLFSAGTLGALNYVVRGLHDLPGRKSVVLMSDGFRLMRSNGTKNDLTFEALRRLSDLANRSSVIVYTMDARGLMTFNPTAADGMIGSMYQLRGFADRAKLVFDTQSGLSFLAEQTGGFAIRNNNDLAGGLKRIVADQDGYYLIGYEPDTETFDPKKLRYNTIKVKVKRKGLVVRSRTGFYGIADERAIAPPPTTRGQIMAAALMSPFNLNESLLQLKTLFGNDAQNGSYVRSFLQIRPQDLTFTDLPDGGHQAVFDLLAVAYGENGIPIDHVSRTYTVQLRDEAYVRALRSGFVYTATIPIQKPGAYQFRVAVRDSVSNRVGSASEFIEVPDLLKNRLLISGIAAFGLDPSVIADAVAATTGPDPELDPNSGITKRRIRSGAILRYGCVIFNAKLDKASGRPLLQTQIRLFRDGVEVFTGPPGPFDAAGQTDLQRLPFSGALRLGTALTPGQYVLQVVVTDTLAKDKNRIATQWIDFEIVP